MEREQKYITGIKRLSVYLGMPVETVKNNINNGIIPKRRLGVNVIFNIEEVDKAISDITNKPLSA
ncbi:hypothetical protein ACFLSU_04665 [Bacteroidota bacterium]